MKNLFTAVFFLLFVASCSSSHETSTDATTSPPTTLAATTTTLAATTTTLAATTTTVAATTTTMPPAPGPVEGLLITPRSESLLVAWSRPTNVFSPDNYEIRWRKHNTPPSDWSGSVTRPLWLACSVDTGLCSHTIWGLENNIETEVEIIAQTDEGGESDAVAGHGIPRAIYESDATLEEFMTGPFSWGPSDDATTLQTVLADADRWFDATDINGVYGYDTHETLIRWLSDRGLSNENLPPVASPIYVEIIPYSDSLRLRFGPTGGSGTQYPDSYEIRWRKHTDPPSGWIGDVTSYESHCFSYDGCFYTIEGLQNDTEYEIEVTPHTDEGGTNDPLISYGTPLQIVEFISGSFVWGPSDDATTLQVALGFDATEIDGVYGFDTYESHVNWLLSRYLSIENVPNPPDVAPYAVDEGEWLPPNWDLVDCELAIYDHAPLCGVEIGTPAGEAITALVSILGPASEDSEWNWEAGCPGIGITWRERVVNWGSLQAVFQGLNPTEFAGWRVYRNIAPLEVNWPDFPIPIPNGLYLGDPLEEVAVSMGYALEDMWMHSFADYGLPYLYRFSGDGYQYGQVAGRIDGVIQEGSLTHVGSPGITAFTWCD